MSALGPVLGFLGVALGAFGAHALKGKVDAELWRTASFYHLVHAVALLSVTAPLPRGLFAAGIVVFSGTVYLLAFPGTPRWLGAITPIGGLLLLAAWASLLVKSRS